MKQCTDHVRQLVEFRLDGIKAVFSSGAFFVSVVVFLDIVLGLGLGLRLELGEDTEDPPVRGRCSRRCRRRGWVAVVLRVR